MITYYLLFIDEPDWVGTGIVLVYPKSRSTSSLFPGGTEVRTREQRHKMQLFGKNNILFTNTIHVSVQRGHHQVSFYNIYSVIMFLMGRNM